MVNLEKDFKKQESEEIHRVLPQEFFAKDEAARKMG